MANELQREHSPYLKQHANNPVHWFPWGKEALTKAKQENKLIIISVGYSACHWCHVMERESFENDAIAETMNKFYVSIKVDREERPDIDQIYMIAVQLMTNAGGWPLNCICLPDGRPIYGGTYFRPNDWQNVLLQIAKMWEETPEVAMDYADRLTQGIQQSERLPILEIPEDYTEKDLQDIIIPWIDSFDKIHGGYKRTPKFPLPNNWLFLLRYGVLSKNQDLLDHVQFTLEKIASGGIYDQIGGGFSRYSVDNKWHIPHFEKMLYDNGQLLSLYSEAYQYFKNPLFKNVVNETIQWAEREMLDKNGGFYSALDADSEGVEGKYYSFSYDDFDILGDDAELARNIFHISKSGNWTEEQTNIPFIDLEDQELILQAGYSAEQWDEHLADIKQTLLTFRQKRIAPGLDNKQIVTFNALMIKGLTDAYRTFENPQHLELAESAAQFILTECRFNDMLLHQPADKNRRIPAFLDDYAFTIEAFISLYESSFDESWLYKAKTLTDQAIAQFYNKDEETFFYTSSIGEELIARKSEIMDNVIPGSVSTMVRQLHRLGILFDETPYAEIANQVFANVFPHIKSYGSAYSNWAILLSELHYGIWEIALTGSKAAAWRREIEEFYIPNKITLGGTKSTLPLLKHKMAEVSTAYVCRNNTCSPPQQSIAEIIELINN